MNSEELVVVLDISGSMGCYDGEIESIASLFGSMPSVVTTVIGGKPEAEPPFEVLSDCGETSIDTDFDYTGGTPLTDIVETALDLTDAPILLVTDGIAIRTGRFEDAISEATHPIYGIQFGTQGKMGEQGVEVLVEVSDDD